MSDRRAERMLATAFNQSVVRSTTQAAGHRQIGLLRMHLQTAEADVGIESLDCNASQSGGDRRNGRASALRSGIGVDRIRD